MEQPLLIDMSIHHFDMLRAMTGTDVTSVYARSWHVPGGAYEDHPAAALIMTLATGATATYDGNWAGFDEDTTWDGEWDILGDGGRIRWRTRDGENQVDLLALDGSPRELAAAPESPTEQLGLLAEFARSVAAGTPPQTEAADNIRSLAIGFAAVESARTGRIIDLSATPGQ
jgi:predicted dehydrogenase